MKAISLPVLRDKQLAYHIHVQWDFSDLAQSAAQELSLSGRRLCIVTDSNVDPLYAAQITALFTGVCSHICKYVIPAGEAHKTLDEIRNIYTLLIHEQFDRKDVLLALGGGVVGDMTGFAAATYLRGIRFIQVPTTLLSQVDSSIGGKTGVDFDQYKNMVGAFHMPSLVYIALQALQTLPDEQFASGMGEVLKHGLIRDGAYYEWCITHMDEIREKTPEALSHLVVESVKIKRAVVEKDPTEQGVRALLNFGHTIGHAIEKLKHFQLFHGQCVALGAVAAAWISHQRGYLDADEFYEIRDMMVGFDLPISYEGPRPQEVLEAMKHDKKVNAGRIRFILLRGIGKAEIDDTVTEEEILDAIRCIYVEE